MCARGALLSKPSFGASWFLQHHPVVPLHTGHFPTRHTCLETLVRCSVTALFVAPLLETRPQTLQHPTCTIGRGSLVPFVCSQSLGGKEVCRQSASRHWSPLVRHMNSASNEKSTITERSQNRNWNRAELEPGYM
eukprot:6461262-Amphidinium_carterae.1